MPFRLVLRWLLLGSLLAFPASRLVAADKLQFNRDIRPILSDTCFHCHGPDEKERQAGLRLDVRQQALMPAESGLPAIVPGQVESSQLLARVFSDDPDMVMPPPQLHKPLTAKQRETLQRWIEEGAEYQGHWAFLPPERPALPPTPPTMRDWGRNEVDHFIAARLAKEGLAPSPAADRATLLRRVTLDLTGLPPTIEDIQAFLDDDSEAAYEKVVDRLLASEPYGEHMARQWLDYARYADSHGFQTDSSRGMWPWRDWVIRAFNENLPFDQFTVQQLAGDLLPQATREQIVATGFHRNHRLNGEGGIIAAEWRIENIIDRVETTSATWLGLTMNCCRCHDHKYDPFTQRDFYGLFAFFNNVPETGTIERQKDKKSVNTPPLISVPTPEQEIQLAAREAAVTLAQEAVKEAEQTLTQRLAVWESTALQQPPSEVATWKPLELQTVKSSGGAILTRQVDGSYLASGINPAKDIYTLEALATTDPITGCLLECLPDPTLPAGSLGRAANGNFALSQFEIEFTVGDSAARPRPVKVAKVEADYSQKGWSIANLTAAGKKKEQGKGWAVDGNTRPQTCRALFVLQSPIPAEARVVIRLKHEALNQHNIGRFRLWFATRPSDELRIDTQSDWQTIRPILQLAADRRSPAQAERLIRYYRQQVDPTLRRLDAAWVKARKDLEKFNEGIPDVMVMQEGEPREAFLLIRGEYDKPGERVAMQTPAVLPPLPAGAPPNRLGLAEWIVAPENPLTARVWVNRTWEKFFGTGLCKTTENLGSQAEWPSHPELLDWLATEFIRLGWDMKAFQKMLVMSAAYRQTSEVTPALWARDPDNRWLARGPRFRLAGEVIRDQALAIGKLLTPRIGGPSVRPYMPEGVWDETSKYGDLLGYRPDKDEGLYRRTLYTVWKRTAAPPTMLLFDAPTREICTVKRSRTNTPLQALALLNEITFVEAARGLAQRMLQEASPSPAARLAHGYLLATGRQIDESALQTLEAGLHRRLDHYRAQPDAASRLVAIGESRPAPALDQAELAAYTTSAMILLNLDRTVTRD